MAESGSNQGEAIPIEIDMVDVLDYVGDSVRPIREGSAVFEANHVLLIGYREKTDEFIKLTGYVTQTSHPNAVPHQIQLKLTHSISSWILSCSCKAGTGKCKHIIACLLFLNRFRKVEYMSCTDAAQAWGKTKMDKKTPPWCAKPIRDLCCVKKITRLQATNADLKKKILQESFGRILKVAENSSVTKRQRGRHMNEAVQYPSRALQSAGVGCEDLSYQDLVFILQLAPANIVNVQPAIINCPEEEIFYKTHVEVNLGKIVEIAQDTKHQGSNLWLIERSKRITASSCYGLGDLDGSRQPAAESSAGPSSGTFTLYTYLSNLNPNWDKKIMTYWNTKNLKTKSVLYGKKTEQKAFECYQALRNPSVKKLGLIFKTGEPWFGASPDGYDPSGRIVLEIKCPISGEHGGIEDVINSKSAQKYMFKCPVNGDFKLKKNHPYFCQIQMNMWVLNAPLAEFILYSLKDDDFIVATVPFEAQYVETVVNRLKNLYFSKMLHVLLSR
ncbi:uncharacterized protein LOC129753023 [Uranotaenia lowii]|uniref:uncharacterized protein LOC129753023 n=1 Tax=Uranotaenia lowii TaxID=190385 RepID=UPI00247A47D9|nr:uncharacterized protein LOC129753023 [Uranotaenia lowii]